MTSLSLRQLFTDYAERHHLMGCLPDEDGAAWFDLGDGLNVMGVPDESGQTLDLRARVPLRGPLDNALARTLLVRNLEAILPGCVLFALESEEEYLRLSVSLNARHLTLTGLEEALARLAEACQTLERELEWSPDETVENPDGAPFANMA
ncbi:CesT family type III secretion system chaperone [Desulfovibrio sp. OttesenSCG-928-M16]|nr:CesT family type III secretion system chaperone [Desulfovibrio sp. OttesenSCG-928-M16]